MEHNLKWVGAGRGIALACGGLAPKGNPRCSGKATPRAALVHPGLIPESEFNPVAHSDFVVDLAEVISDDLLVNSKFSGDVPILQPSRHQLNHSKLPSGRLSGSVLVGGTFSTRHFPPTASPEIKLEGRAESGSGEMLGPCCGNNRRLSTRKRMRSRERATDAPPGFNDFAGEGRLRVPFGGRSATSTSS
jgi:hypothetical protein